MNDTNEAGKGKSIRNQDKKDSSITIELIEILSKNQFLMDLLQKSIRKAKEINSCKRTNPVQTVGEYFDYLDWASTAMPWNISGEIISESLYTKIDQSLNYFYFLHDIPLEELEGQGLYNNSIQYLEPFRLWLIKFTQNWGQFLSKPESWNEKYYQLVYRDACFGLQSGQYESPEHWHSFNDFFARHLVSENQRPISAPSDERVIVSPADSVPLGVWRIDENSMIEPQHGEIVIKSQSFRSVADLIGPDSQYKFAFSGGFLTHMFLDVHNYHRFHFPVSGVILEVSHIRQASAAGGRVTWDHDNGLYMLDSSTPDWQMLETRACVIVNTGKFGLVAIMPIGMSQVASVNFEPNVAVNHKVKKGEKMGYFLFGGSNVVLIFQRDSRFTMTAPQETGGNDFQPILTGQEYGRFDENGGTLLSQAADNKKLTR